MTAIYPKRKSVLPIFFHPQSFVFLTTEGGLDTARICKQLSDHVESMR